jgi:RNA polymerase sigma-70 factor, ECF subfamily
MAEAEREAVAALQRGDVAGLGTLVRLHQVRALRTAYAITGDQTSAEDAVADAFVLVYEHIAQFDPARPFAPWFYRIVANRALSGARQERRVLTGEVAEAMLATQADPASGPEEEALHDELRSLVVLAIKELLPAQRVGVRHPSPHLVRDGGDHQRGREPPPRSERRPRRRNARW